MTKSLDISGQVFGTLTALRIAEKDKWGAYLWECVCTCGRYVKITAAKLRRGFYTRACVCQWDITNQPFGDLTALSPIDGKITGSSKKWNCLCICGKETQVRYGHLRNGLIQSCGCTAREKISKRTRKNITGLRSGKLVALSPTADRYHSNIVWKCLCDCGNIHYVCATLLLRENTLSCGCLVYDNSKCYLYCMKSESTGLIKIGISNNPFRRCKHLKKETRDNIRVLFYKTGSKREETLLHSYLAGYKTINPKQPRGREWFRLSDRVLGKINETMRDSIYICPDIVSILGAYTVK